MSRTRHLQRPTTVGQDRRWRRSETIKGCDPKYTTRTLYQYRSTNTSDTTTLNQHDERYEFYHKDEEKIPFDLEKFNYITKGGLPNKTLNVALAGTGVGKSLFMCHCASAALMRGATYSTLH